MNKATGYFLLLSLIVLMGCTTKKSFAPREYVKWVNEELSVSKEIGDFEFAMLYKPLEYVVLMQEKDEQITAERMDTLAKEYNEMQYFTFKISSKTEQDMLRTGIKTDQEYYQRLEYFVSMMQDDIELVSGEDTLPCQLYHFERNYGLAPYNNINLGFRLGNSKNAESKMLIYNDQVLGVGPVLLAIKKDLIENIPSLKTN